MRSYLLMCVSLFICTALFAGDKDKGKEKNKTKDSVAVASEEVVAFVDSVNKSMKWQTGTIQLPGGEAQLQIPTGFKFLGAEQSQQILETYWGNLKDGSVLGMIFPEKFGPFDDNSWVYVVRYEGMGYVKDDDADKIDYDDLLKQIKEDVTEENKERLKQGLKTFSVIGWAQKPYYDKDRKVLHWAKEFKVEGSEGTTINYDIRVLGRKGVLSLGAICSRNELPEINKEMDQVLKMAKFTDGNKYSDFNPDVDNVAAWTIGGLVAGKVLAKVGFFAVILKFLKFIVIGVVAVGGAIWRFITGRKKTEESNHYTPTDSQE